MTFDVRQVDQNLQAIAAIEAAWDLPGLPDDVKLDLAAIASPPVLAQVLTGLEDDFVEAERRDAAYPTRFDLGFSEPYNPTAYAYTGREQVGRTLAGVFGLEPPQQLSPDAAVRLKSRLAEGGYLNLTPEEIHSEQWLPEYSYAASRFNFDEMTARFQGNEPGSFSVDQIFDWVDQWLSPRGLYRAAVELDLFWDAEAIEHDLKTWGDKWRAWSDDKLNVRKLLDALTGPVDDLLFPILNIGLMFTGIGEVIGVGRALHLGFKGADAVSDLYRSSKLIVAGADDVARFAQPSRLSSKIGGMGKAGEFVSDKMMDAWRAKGSVIMAKKVNQQVLRAGFISNVQQWVDADRGGASISHWTGGALSDRTFQMMSNPALDWGVDLLLYPTNIFNPGTFSRPLRAITKGVQQGLSKAANNQSLLHGFDQAITQTLQEAVERGDELAAEQLARYQDLRRGSVKEAIRDTFFEGNEEQMGAALAYITTSAALDYHARRLADVTVGNPLHTFDTTTRRHFHHHRNMLVGQLRPMDPNNLNEVFRHLAKYGDGSGEFQPVMRRGAKHFYRRLREIEDAFLEPWEDMRKRGAAVPAGHTRFIGHWDEAGEVFSWRPLRAGDPLEGDPFFVDVRDADLLETMGDEAASVLSGASELPEEFANRYLRHDADGHLRHHRLSEAGKFRILSEQGAQRLRDVVRRHNELRNAKLDEIMAELDPDVIASYMYQVMPTLGRWNEFVEATHMVDEFANRGDLLNVRLTTPISESGRRLSAMPVATSEAQTSWQSQIGELITELADDEKLYNQLMTSVFAPLARHVDPAQGMFTVALKDTVDKAEALQFAASARRLVSLYESLGSLRSKGLWNDVVEIAAELTEETKVTSTVVRELLAHRIAAEALSEKSVEAAAGLIRRARAEKVSLDELEDVLLKKLHALDADEAWSTRYNVQSDLKPKRGADTVQGRVLAKAKELQRLSEFMATTVEGAPKALVDALDARGYKLVYGVDFAQPPDVDGLVPMFRDIKARHVRQKALGDFFSRQDGPTVAALKARKLKDSLHAELSKVPSEGGKPLHLGAHPGEPNADMRELMNDLRSILHEHWEAVDNQLDSAGSRWWEKIAVRASQAHVAGDINSLASAMGTKLIDALRGRGYSQAQATAIYNAIQRSRALGFRTHGLYAIESSLRGKPWLSDGLRLLGTTDQTSTLRKVGKGSARFAIGLPVGGMAANAVIGDQEAADSDAGMLARGAGMVIGGALGIAAGRRLGAVAGKLERGEYGAKMVAWNFLGDQLANMRDTARFSLSPIFDASRYSEAIILNQIGELPEGVRNLRVRQSPSAWRKTRARHYKKAGMDDFDAKNAAMADWRRLEQEFAAAARGHYDFDLESHHETMRRFRSVGILGFSPTDWMTSTFGHLREAGVSAEKAYETVRNIYTYGMTGRSAAELSMNFVFFPFSFTKKTVGHFAKFFAEDLGRLIVMHDAVATYQLLDEHYDLSEMWKDRFPILQKAHRLNLLAYGIGLGQFGGVNAPMAEAFGRLPGIRDVVDYVPGREEIVNAFLPQMVPLETMDQGEDLWQMVRGMLPVVNDVNTLIGSLVEQGYVLGSEHFLTRAAEQRHAWEEWRAWQQQATEELAKRNMSWRQAVRNDMFNLVVQRKRAELLRKYPAWEQGLGDGIAHSNAIRLELEERIHYPTEPADEYLFRFHQFVETVESVVGFTFDGAPERMPPELFGYLRRTAIDFVRQEPMFLRLYNRFYRRLLGDIAMDI